MSEYLGGIKFKIAILDEAHYLKNPEAKRTEAMVPVIQQCKRVMILSGTPAFALPKELFNILSMIRPDVFVDIRDFGNRYCGPQFSPFTHKIEYLGSTCSQELHYY